ncbi:MAG: Ig-like domain-containing protein, partial [Lachnospiraceae bacterium]
MGKKKTKRIIRRIAYVLALIMLIQSPVEYISYASAEPVPLEKTRESMDWTHEESLFLELTKISSQNEDKIQQETLEQEGIFDLSNYMKADPMKWEIKFAFTNLTKTTPQAGDTFTMTLPREYFLVEDTTEEQQVSTAGEEVIIGSYTIKDQVITVVLKEEIEHIASAGGFARLVLPVQWNQKQLENQTQ